jgi:hypothetical protein
MIPVPQCSAIHSRYRRANEEYKVSKGLTLALLHMSRLTVFVNDPVAAQHVPADPCNVKRLVEMQRTRA